MLAREEFDGEIVFVPLEMKKTDRRWSIYKPLSAVSKINTICRRIEAICRRLQQTAPEAMWLIFWPENAIRGKSGQLALSEEEAIYFKAKMQILSAAYKKNLVILAGSTQIYEHVTENVRERLEKIKQYYSEDIHFNKLKERENKDDTISKKDKQIAFHEAKVDELLRQKTLDSFYIVYDGCFLFKGDEIQIHKKVMPFSETRKNKTLQPHIVFQPGEEEYADPVFTIEHPLVNSGQAIKIAAEICREHGLNYLTEAVDFHCVLSDSIKLRQHQAGDRTLLLLQADSYMDFQPYLVKRDNVPNNILIYKNNLFAASSQLTGPIKPIYPFERDVTDEIDAMMQSLDAESHKRQLLAKMRVGFLMSNKIILMEEVLKKYKELIHYYRPILLNKELLGTQYSLFKMTSPIAAMLQRIKILIAQQEALLAPKLSEPEENKQNIRPTQGCINF